MKTVFRCSFKHGGCPSQCLAAFGRCLLAMRFRVPLARTGFIGARAIRTVRCAGDAVVYVNDKFWPKHDPERCSLGMMGSWSVLQVIHEVIDAVGKRSATLLSSRQSLNKVKTKRFQDNRV